MSTDVFPRELVRESKAARVAYFKAYTVAHPLLKEVDDKLWKAVQSPGDATLICLYGPTGIGKTTVAQRIKQRILEQSRAEMERDLCYLPVAAVDAASPESGNYSWQGYYRRALATLNDPFYGRTEIMPKLAANWRSARLRHALERALTERRVAAFIIDEAQHMTKMASGRRLQDQMDCIKSLAGTTGTLHILSGTYELLAFRNLSAQLIRRSIDIHFRRYRIEEKEDAKAWKSVLWAFERHLPLEEKPDLVSQEARSCQPLGVLLRTGTRLRRPSQTLVAESSRRRARPEVP